MEIQQLKYFVQVAKLRNFTRAAEVCRVAQPSLSQQIQTLEKFLGAPLFHRQGRQICLTEAGEHLLPRAIHILESHEAVVQELCDLSNRGGRVRVGAILTIAPYLIPRLFRVLPQREWKEMQIEENFTDNLLGQLREGSLDFAIMSTPVADGQLMVDVLASEPFKVVMSKKHSFAKRRELSIAEVLDASFLPLSRIHCAGQQIHALCKLNDKAYAQPFQTAQIETILRLLELGEGISVLPEMALDSLNSRKLVVCDLERGSLKREISLVYHPDRYLSKRARGLMQTLRKLLEGSA